MCGGAPADLSPKFPMPQLQATVPITRGDFWAIRLVFFLEAVVLGAWLPRIPDMKDALSLSDGVLGLCLAGAPAGTLVGFTVAARVSTRLGLRRASMVGGAAFPLSLMLLGFAPNAPALFAALLIKGLTIAQLEVAMNAKAGQMEMLSGRRIMSRCHGFWSIGAVVGALIGGGFAEAGFSTAAQFLIVSPVAAVAAWVVGASLPVGPPGAKPTTRVIGLDGNFCA